MSGRASDWFGQAESDLATARSLRDAGHHEWACFAAQQAAEKAVKALILTRGGEPWGHSVLALLGALPEELEAPEAIVAAGRDLDKLYIPTRYPNGFDQGKPADYFSDSDAREALAQAEAILDFCRRRLPRS